jgi:type VI protein secretion system component VasF
VSEGRTVIQLYEDAQRPLRDRCAWYRTRTKVRARALPPWLGWAAVVVGVVVFFLGLFFMPMLLLVLWAIVASIVCLRRPIAGAAN